MFKLISILDDTVIVRPEQITYLCKLSDSKEESYELGIAGRVCKLTKSEGETLIIELRKLNLFQIEPFKY